MDQRNLPFSYEWEDDGDVDLRSGGVAYEVEHPLDALDDVLESFADHHAKGSTIRKTAGSMSEKWTPDEIWPASRCSTEK